MNKTIYLNNSDSFFGSLDCTFFGRDVAEKAIKELAAHYYGQQPVTGKTIHDLERQGWDELDEYEFVGRECDWTDLVNADYDTLSAIRHTGAYIIEEESQEITPLVCAVANARVTINLDPCWTTTFLATDATEEQADAALDRLLKLLQREGLARVEVDTNNAREEAFVRYSGRQIDDSDSYGPIYEAVQNIVSSAMGDPATWADEPDYEALAAKAVHAANHYIERLGAQATAWNTADLIGTTGSVAEWCDMWDAWDELSAMGAGEDWAQETLSIRDEEDGIPLNPVFENSGCLGRLDTPMASHHDTIPSHQDDTPEPYTFTHMDANGDASSISKE